MNVPALRWGSLIQVNLKQLPSPQDRTLLRAAIHKHYGQGLRKVDGQTAFFANTGHMITMLIATGDGPQRIDQQIQDKITSFFHNLHPQSQPPTDLFTLTQQGALPSKHDLLYTLSIPALSKHGNRIRYTFNPRSGKCSLVSHEGMGKGCYSATSDVHLYLGTLEKPKKWKK